MNQTITQTAGARIAPGPRRTPLFGNVLEAWRDPLTLFLNSTRAHGDVVKFRFGPYDYFLLNDAEAVKHLLVDHHKNYTKSRNYKGLKLILGEGLITSEGEHWRRQRKLAQPAFHKERLASFVACFANDTASMLDRWARDRLTELDVHEEMMRLTFRIVGRTLLSVDVDGAAREIGEALSVVLHHANEYAESLVPIPIWVPLPENFRFKRAIKVLDDLVYGIIAERRRSGGSGAQHDDLLALLMEAVDEQTRETMTDLQLRDEVMTLVLAGHETTANALSWTWALLSRHPDVERKLRAEVDAVLQGRAPTADDLPNLRYTAMVVQEAMRLYPPVWIFERQAIEADTILGFSIPKGSIVGVSPYALHRNARYWENPEGFDPERFSTARSSSRPRHAYLPFAVGPRQCIGNAFALMEAQVIVAMMVQRHRLELVPGEKVEPDPKVTLRPLHGVRVAVKSPATEPSVRPPTREPGAGCPIHHA